jgi:hypothetical protein
MIKVKKLKTSLKGRKVSTNKNGSAGRQIENLVEQDGFIINRGKGCDLQLAPDASVEIKTRDLSATSPQSVGAMKLDAIKVTPYKVSPIYDKIQQQYRVKTKDRVVVTDEIYDFSGWSVQSLIEEAYEEARKQIIAGNTSDYIYGTKWGYFERTNKKSHSWQFRLSDGAMKKLEQLSKSTFDNIFEIAQ